ncbi:MAG: insulinase family protein [Muribaculaceae bacterium]|nr:insulinase family protein [Muribaculaceae bacterium]
MKHYLLVLAAILIALSGNAELRTGVLPNGLTYYIRSNDTPSGMADFYLAQRAGSVNETEDERGLAHFLEHLCFNGTKHFPGNSLITWLESNGVKFGKNLNAYTSTDETVYNISKVPMNRKEVLDSCLLILQDWCSDVTLDPKAIDEERGVIENEWRHRNSATNRQLEKALPYIYPGSIYGQRMPIGKMEVVKNFKPKTLKGFYNKWYHPENQAVIVVGDIDPDYVEAQVKSMFGGIKRKGNAIKGLPEVPANEKLIVVCEFDPEQATNLVQLHFRHPEYENELAADLAGSMLAARFDEIELDPECPHTYLGVGETKFMLSRGVKSLVMRGVAKPGKAADAIKLWYSELSRAYRHGFTQEELDIAKKQMAKDLNDKKKKAAKSNSTDYARRYVRNFIDRTEPTEIADEYDRKLALLNAVTLADTEKYIKSVVNPDGKNAVIISYSPEKEDYPVINPEELSNAFYSVNALELLPYQPHHDSGNILDNEPTAGSITGKKPYIYDGAIEYTLSNGIKVIAWQSAEVPDQIFIRGIGQGGLSQNYNEKDAPTLKMINDVLAVCGAGERTANDLKNLGLSRKINTSLKITNTEESIESATTKEDMTDAFRMIHQKATDLRADMPAINAMLNAERNKLRNQHVNPIQVMGDSIHRNVYSRHPLGAKETVELVNNVDPELALNVYRDRFGDMADFVFYVAGDFNTDSLENCLSRYIASLPTNGRIETPKDINYRFTQANQTIDFTRPMSSPVGVVYNFYTGNSEYDLPHVIAATAFGQILRTRLMDELREKRGWTYSVQGHCSVSAGMNGTDSPTIMMPSYIKVEPGHEDETNAFVQATVADMLANGVTDQELNKVKEYLAKNYKENLTDNAYRLIVMHANERFGKDMHTDYLKALDELKDIRPYVKDLNRWHSTLIMRPE